MYRRVLLFGLATSTLVAGLAVASAAPAGLACEAVNEKVFIIKVDDSGAATPACVEVRKGKTKLIWTGGMNVSQLVVVFKAPALCPGSDPTVELPPNPDCAGDECTLEKAKHKTKGTFCYSTVVIRDDGTVRNVDPQLIIKP